MNNKSIKKILGDNKFQMYFIKIEGKPFFGVKLIKILRKQINNYMTNFCKNPNIDKLDKRSIKLVLVSMLDT